MRIGLRSRLLGLLLAFGVLPLAVTMLGGYAVSRGIITDQARRALREVVSQQAVHVGAELDRERLLLRTIAGHLPTGPAFRTTPTPRLRRLLVEGLPEGGVFDGLRLVRDDGRVLASVALRNTAPDWPSAAPATDWSTHRVAVHRDDRRVLAYLVAVPVLPAPHPVWLEGHVRAPDFNRIFGLPAHVLGGAEIVIRGGGDIAVAAGHAHGAPELLAAFGPRAPDSTRVSPGDVAGESALLAAAPVPNSEWTVLVGLPLDVALAPLARLRDAAVLGVLILIALIVVTGAAASRSLTGTLRELAGAARQFGRRGEFPPVTSSRGDEVGELVDAFNHMADDLHRSRDEIERLHAEQMERAHQLATVGELASGVAHEIRNPLTGVRGALELALKHLAPDERARPLLEEAQNQLTRIETTTTQLLRYARPPEMREIVVNVNEIVERAVRVVAPQAAHARVEITQEPSPDHVRVRADPELMVQVLVNLLLNALEVSPEAGAVGVWIARRAPEVWIGVRDSGPGVPHEMRDRIFRPFFTTKARGTGLGLSLSRQIVARHHGGLRVEDTPGGGATFVVNLPLVSEHDS